MEWQRLYGTFNHSRVMPFGKFSATARVFIKKNVRYPVWTCRDPISLILGIRFTILGTQIGFLKRLKETLAAANGRTRVVRNQFRTEEHMTKIRELEISFTLTCHWTRGNLLLRGTVINRH